MKYCIYINNNFVTDIGGTEASYDAFIKACEFANIIGATVSLVDGDTGEVVAFSDDKEFF